MTTREQPVLLRMKDVTDLLSVSRRTVERWVQSGEFPAPLRLGGRSIGWHRVDVENWLEDLRWEHARNEHMSAVEDPDAPF